jgi:hypothetical protein
MTARLEGTQTVVNAFSKIIDQINSHEAMRNLGGYLIQTIRKRTRGEAKGVSVPGGNAARLRRVTDKYAKWRVKQQRHPEAATGRTSNLTFKGKMLDAMILKRATKSQLFIGFRSQKEADKAEWQEEQGRRFLVLSGKEIKDAAAYVKRNLARR